MFFVLKKAVLCQNTRVFAKNRTNTEIRLSARCGGSPGKRLLCAEKAETVQ
jgi:hypothetical protein